MSDEQKEPNSNIDFASLKSNIGAALTNILERIADFIEGIKNMEAPSIVMLIGIVSVILSFNGIETWGICGALAIVLSAFGITLADRTMAEADQESKLLNVGKILSGIGLGAGIACLVIGILVGIIGSLAVKANA